MYAMPPDLRMHGQLVYIFSQHREGRLTKPLYYYMRERESAALLMLYYCFTSALLLLYFDIREREAPESTAALLLLYYCFTTALLLLYYCFTTALPVRASRHQKRRPTASRHHLHTSAYVSIRQRRCRASRHHIEYVSEPLRQYLYFSTQFTGFTGTKVQSAPRARECAIKYSLVTA